MHAFRTFSNDLKSGEFPAVLFLYGEEDYLIDWAVGSLVRRFVNDAVKSLDYVRLEDDVTADGLIEACETFSMFSERRVVWAKNYLPLNASSPRGFTERDREKLLSYVASPNEGTLLVFSTPRAVDPKKNDKPNKLVQGLIKDCLCYNFEKLDRATLTGFIEKRFRAGRVNCDRNVLRYLIDESGYFNRESEYRIFNLDNDVKKIIAHSDGVNVTIEDVAKTLNGDMDTFAFDFLDAISGGRKDVAFTLLHNILAAGSEAFSVVALLVNHFELILQVKEFRDEGMQTAQMVSKLKVHEFRVKKAASVSDKFTTEKLRNILIQLYEIDRNTKNGTLDTELALELLVGGI